MALGHADVHIATTSAQAFTLANVVEPRLAILDVVMPRVDGLELVAALRKYPPFLHARHFHHRVRPHRHPLRAAEVDAVVL